MPAGRPPKPTEVKRLLGNPGKRALPEPTVTIEAAASIPPAPLSLKTEGRRKWRQLWKVARKWLSPNTDAMIVERYCGLWDEIEFLTAQLADENGNLDSNRYFQPTRNDGLTVHPAVRELRKCQILMTKLESLLGLNPSDRTRLGLAEMDAKSKLDAFLRRQKGDQ